MYVMNHGNVALQWQLNNGSFDFLLSLFAAAISIQIALFFFNLLPAYPLDGGKILASSLAFFRWERIRVMQITAFVGGVRYTFLIIWNDYKNFFHRSFVFSSFCLFNFSLSAPTCSSPLCQQSSCPIPPR
jgi:Zn-dependent protease